MSRGLVLVSAASVARAEPYVTALVAAGVAPESIRVVTADPDDAPTGTGIASESIRVVTTDPAEASAGAGAEPVPAVATALAAGEGARIANIAELADVAAGLVLCGGEDVDPRRYGEEPLPAANVEVSPRRDALEWALLTAARARRVPVWGICRGFQVLNVFFGGSLWQDLPLQRPETPESTETRETAETGAPKAPNARKAQGPPEAPTAPDAREVREIPEAPNARKTQETPKTLNGRKASETPEAPKAPETPKEVAHDPGPPNDRLAHTVRLLAPGAPLGERLAAGGTTPLVNSRHHQGVRRLGAGLLAVAAAPDGLIEAAILSADAGGIGGADDNGEARENETARKNGESGEAGGRKAGEHREAGGRKAGEYREAGGREAGGREAGEYREAGENREEGAGEYGEAGENREEGAGANGVAGEHREGKEYREGGESGAAGENGAGRRAADGWWVRGVEWHPENLLALPEQMALWRDFAAAVANAGSGGRVGHGNHGSRGANIASEPCRHL